MTKVSIIVPVYNAEGFIKKSIDSILSQTFQDIEVILVDDGSPDKSGIICDEYASKDSRVRVIHQENGGVSVARQTGLDAATGEYLIHVDPDDWIEENEIEELYSKAKSEDADIVISDYWQEDNNVTTYISQDPGNLTSGNIIRQLLTQELYGCCWNKLYKRHTILKYEIRFTPNCITYCEDLLFNCRILNNNNLRISYLPHAYYHYFWNRSSNLSSSKSIKNTLSRIKVNTIIEEILPSSNSRFLLLQKKDVLFELFLLKQFDILKTIYPETRRTLLEKKCIFHWFTPNSSCFSIALKGHPYLAYYLYYFLLFIIKVKNVIKKISKAI